MAEHRGVPRWIQGVWRRAGRAIGDAAIDPIGKDGVEEVSAVVWAQVGPYFADVRVPVGAGAAIGLCHLDEAQAFSGSFSYAGKTATWTHDLDTKSRPTGYADSALLERQGHTVVERGPGYVEVWQRTARGSAAVVQRVDRVGAVRARVIVVADYVVAVWGGRRRGGATLLYDDGGWEVAAYVGSGAIPWAAVTEARAGRVAAGWTKAA